MHERDRPAGRAGQTGMKDILMREYYLYLNAKKPSVGLYVRQGASLADFSDREDWVFDGTLAGNLVPPAIADAVETNGHAFGDMA